MLSSSYAYCHVPVAPLKAEPSHRSEIISQVLFGEKVHILSPVQNGWIYIACQWDNYCGWVKESQITYITKKTYVKSAKYITAQQGCQLMTNNGTINLALGSSILSIKKGQVTLTESLEGKLKGKKINIKNIEANEPVCRKWAMEYYGAPYLWGGRTNMGIDCSGFSQMVYKMMNISLPRDAYQQAEQGTSVDFLMAAQCGDLAFFDNEEGKIIHVGILLDNNSIIHATEHSGGVVIDKIDAQGIISNRFKVRTHQLRLIKRFL